MNNNIRIRQIENGLTADLSPLLRIWESAVKATHGFLTDDEIETIRNYVPQALRSVPLLFVAEDGGGSPAAFMGIDGRRLEMLFVSAENMGHGIGKRLLLYAVDVYSVNELTVNEQNLHAAGFYKHMGFQVCKRTEKDEQGNPYPILYMKKKL